MYTVEKTFTGDLAHRIHNQTLDGTFTENNSTVLKCRRFHGHTFALKVKLGSEKLVSDMVIDYNEFGFVKNMIADVLDHRTLISESDPLFRKVIQRTYEGRVGSQTIMTITEYMCSKIDLSLVADADLREFFDSFTVVQFTTSSENIARWIFAVVSDKIQSYNLTHNTDVRVLSVSYKETPNSEAVYSGKDTIL